MNNNVSPVCRMELIEKIEKTIWDKFKTYKKVEQYISMNQEVYNNFGDVDFSIIYNESQKIDLITITSHRLYKRDFVTKN